jgi:hypothetical protein
LQQKLAGTDADMEDADDGSRLTGTVAKNAYQSDREKLSQKNFDVVLSVRCSAVHYLCVVSSPRSGMPKTRKVRAPCQMWRSRYTNSDGTFRSDMARVLQ